MFDLKKLRIHVIHVACKRIFGKRPRGPQSTDQRVVSSSLDNRDESSSETRTAFQPGLRRACGSWHIRAGASKWRLCKQAGVGRQHPAFCFVSRRRCFIAGDLFGFMHISSLLRMKGSSRNILRFCAAPVGADLLIVSKKKRCQMYMSVQIHIVG